MADGFDIHLNEDQARRLKAAAEASGVEPSVYALQVLERAMATSQTWTVREEATPWTAEEDARWAEYERTGVSIPAEEALAEFRRNLRERLATR